MKHDEYCERSGKWYKLRACQEFSTDGTSLGAAIAHLYGTTDEKEIERLQAEERRGEMKSHLTGMEDEQADWDAEE